jgi:hypothetical protein
MLPAGSYVTSLGGLYVAMHDVIDVKKIMTNDFKMIVFKQLTISRKTQHDNKINVSCSANQQNVTLLYHMLNMTILNKTKKTLKMISLRLYRSASGWYNLNAHGSTRR